MINNKIGEVWINGVDAFLTYGVFFEESALSSLMMPAPTKDTPEDSSPLLHGKITNDSNAKVDSKDFTMVMQIAATDLSDFFSKYEAFCENVLEHRSFTLKCKFFPTKLFRLQYKSCTQFQEYYLTGTAKFILRLTEPNPKNRSL